MECSMNGFKVLLVLCGIALVFAACAVPLGQDYIITRDASLTYITDYNLQTYVPIPVPGQPPVIQVAGRTDLEAAVVWKDENGEAAALPFDRFAPDTVYQAEIKITPKEGYGFYATPFTYAAGKVESQQDDLGDPARTITVKYNNSDDWDITYITDYNLQNYVPIPLAGEKPVRALETREDLRVQAVWQVETASGAYDNIAPDPFVFALGAVYKAAIRLTAKPGYRFIPGRPFVYPDNLAISSIPDTNAGSLRYEVIYPPTVSPIVIDDLYLTPYVAMPIGGATPVVSFGGFQYAGIVKWYNTHSGEPLTGPFQPNTAYTAELALSPGPGYTFTGVGENAFIHTGAEALTNPPGSGSVTIAFPPSPAVGSPTIVYDTVLTGRLPKPVNGVTPITGITGSQYSGTVVWSPPDSTFQLNTSYTAMIALTAAPGYTFTGIKQDVFTHGDAPGTVTNPPGSGMVTIVFPAARTPSHSAMRFGPREQENSALAVLAERRLDSSQVFVDLPPDQEDVAYSAVLVLGSTSPANVIIDGHGRTLTKTTPGPLITVGGGVTLTLQNITLVGHPANNTPLVEVPSGGKLRLGAGAALIDNKTNSEAGGVWVNGGTLNLNAGSAIRGMEARRAGGVLVTNKGSVVMGGGTIGGSETGEGNRVSGAIQSGGGVLVDNGYFDMVGGAIEGNIADAEYSGGGVAALKGYFDQRGGAIRGNIAKEPNSGGGVYAFYDGGYEGFERIFTMSVSAVVEGNIAEAEHSGGGVFSHDRGFYMEAGTIRGNRAQAPHSGGGMYARSDNYQYLFSMAGGFITGNYAKAEKSAGGLYLNTGDDTGAGYTLTGGVIRGNIAEEADSGGGVAAMPSDPDGYGGSVEIKAITIENNIAEESGSAGGLYAFHTGIFMAGGTIQGNEARGSGSAGGAYFDVTGNLDIFIGDEEIAVEDGPVIRANKASSSAGISAGAVYVTGATGFLGRIFMRGGIIGGSLPGDANTAVSGVNGVYLSPDTSFQLYRGTITGNTKSGSNNYGVYVDNLEDVAFSIEYDGKAALHSGDNLVFLAPGASIYVDSLNGGGRVANITCDNPTTTTKLLCAHNSTSIDADRFWFEGAPVSIRIEGGSPYYGYYNNP
jgi:hypothetical protein